MITMLTKFWSNLTSVEIKNISSNKVLIFPFSSIEQHGKHLPVGTDKLILEGILDKFSKISSKTSNFIIMPHIFLGSASEHSSYSGTISINSSMYIDYITEYVEQFCKKRFKKFIFLNSHGGQISHLDIVAKELKSKYKTIDIIKANYSLFDGFDKVINENELKFGYHGGDFETSLMLYLYPLLVKKNLIKKNVLSPDFKSKSIISYEKNVKRAWNTEDINKSGIIGNPVGSSSLKGKQILDITLNTLKKIVMELS